MSVFSSLLLQSSRPRHTPAEQRFAYDRRPASHMIYSGEFAIINSVEFHGIEAPHKLATDEPQVLILDDVLVNTDPVRQDRILDVLGAQAARLQIRILTCHPDRYRGVGRPITITS